MPTKAKYSGRRLPLPSGYSGGDVWGSTPVVDASRNTVFVGTGNNYSIPTDPAYVACIAAGGTEASCLSPDDHADSIIALDMTTGAVKWATRLMTWNQYGVTDGSDFWNVACFYHRTPTVRLARAQTTISGRSE